MTICTNHNINDCSGQITNIHKDIDNMRMINYLLAFFRVNEFVDAEAPSCPVEPLNMPLYSKGNEQSEQLCMVKLGTCTRI